MIYVLLELSIVSPKAKQQQVLRMTAKGISKCSVTVVSLLLLAAGFDRIMARHSGAVCGCWMWSLCDVGLCACCCGNERMKDGR